MFGAERTVSQSPSPIPGRLGYPLAEATPSPGRRTAGGALDAARSTINENGRDGCNRPGREPQEVEAPMAHAEYTDALAALRAAVRRGERHVDVQCPDRECGFALLLVDDSALSFDGDGSEDYRERVFVIEPGDLPDPELGHLTRCPGCLDPIRDDLVVLRDRALAEVA